jgi:hypothetical protein
MVTRGCLVVDVIVLTAKWWGIPGWLEDQIPGTEWFNVRVGGGVGRLALRRSEFMFTNAFVKGVLLGDTTQGVCQGDMD